MCEFMFPHPVQPNTGHCVKSGLVHLYVKSSSQNVDVMNSCGIFPPFVVCQCWGVVGRQAAHVEPLKYHDDGFIHSVTSISVRTQKQVNCVNCVIAPGGTSGKQCSKPIL